MRRPALHWSRRRWLIVAAALAVVVAGLAVAWVVRDGEESRLDRALALAPESSARFSWTDWAAVRADLGADLSTKSSGDDVASFLLDAFDRDLSSTTALDSSAPTIQDVLGFSPGTIDWELFAQGDQGAVIVMGLPDGYDVEELRDRLRSAGYEDPGKADGVWYGGADLVAKLGPDVTPELASFQFDDEEHVLYASDDASYLAERADTARGDRDDSVAQVARASGDALSAVLYTGDQVCSELSLGDADPAERTRAAELVQQAGGVHPLTGYAMGIEPGGGVRVAMTLDDDDQAREDADSRSRLAAGPAPGQGGTFPERFTLGRVVADGTLVTMALEPVGDAAVLSDLSDGPLLFATC